MDKLFLGIKSHVVCIHKRTGQELWRTKLRTSSITNVYYENDFVYAYAGGHLFCINVYDGSIVWENQLKGLGYSTCIIASEQQSSAVVSAQVSAQQAAASTTTVAHSGGQSDG